MDVQMKTRRLKCDRSFVAEQQMTFPEARLVATQVKGRLLTISSEAEERMISEQARGLSLWMSGWCATDRIFRDERNRPLRYSGRWGLFDNLRQPDNRNGNETRLQVSTRDGLGWNDVYAGGSQHACIEWGEEYPEAQ